MLLTFFSAIAKKDFQLVVLVSLFNFHVDFLQIPAQVRTRWSLTLLPPMCHTVFYPAWYRYLSSSSYPSFISLNSFSPFRHHQSCSSLTMSSRPILISSLGWRLPWGPTCPATDSLEIQRWPNRPLYSPASREALWSVSTRTTSLVTRTFTSESES